MIWWPTEIPTLQHGLITLRPANDGDISEVYKACQDPLIPRFTTVPADYTMADARYFIREKGPAHFLEKKELLFVITQSQLSEKVFCGVISFHTIDLGNHCAELGYWITAPSRGKGIGTTAAKLITEYGFTTMGFRRIEALVDVANEASKKLLTAAGYNLEGIMCKKVTRADGSQKDMALFAKLNE
jgi:ribosomal-protein-alanine N-acetyltransferase